MARYPLFLLILGHFIVDLYGSFLSPLQPFLISKYGINLVQAGFLVTLYSLSASLLQPVYGFLADRFKRNIFVVIGPFMAAVFMAGLSQAPDYSGLLFFLFLGGVGVASFHPQASSLNHFYSGERKGFSMSLFISAGNFGSALGPLVLMLGISHLGLESTFVMALPGLIVALLLLYLWRSRDEAEKWPSGAPVISELRKFFKPLGSLYTIVVFRTLVQLAFLTYIPVLLKEHGLPPVWIGAAVTAFLGAGAIGGMVAGYLYDLIGGKRLFLFSSLVSPVFLVLAPRIQDPLLMLILLFLSGFFLMMTIPISVLMGQSIVPNAISTVSSFMMGFGWGTGGLLIPLVGALAERFSIAETLSLLGMLPWFYSFLTMTLPQTEASMQEPVLRIRELP